MTAISFPRVMPDDLLVTGLSFMPQPMVEIDASRGGETFAADLGPTLWRGTWESAQMSRESFGIARAWAHTLISAQRFLAYDKVCEYPLAYPGGWGGLTVSGSPFNGTCKIKSVDSAVLLTLKTLPTTGFKLSSGDYLAFNYGANGARALHMIVAGGLTVSGEVQVEVRPFIRTGAAANDVVDLYRASALMSIVPNSYSERWLPPDFGTLSFDAVQVKA